MSAPAELDIKQKCKIYEPHLVRITKLVPVVLTEQLFLKVTTAQELAPNSVNMGIYTPTSRHQPVKPGTFFLVSAANNDAIGAKIEGNTPKWTVSPNQELWDQKWALDQSGVAKSGRITYKLRSKSTQAYLNTTGKESALFLSKDGLDFEFTQISVPSKPDMVVELSGNTLQLGRDSTTPGEINQQQRWRIYRDPSPPITPGTYYILNKRTQTTLDLHHGETFRDDLTPVRCHSMHGKDNQQWAIEHGNEGYTIKSIGSGTYVGFRAGLLISKSMSVTGNANPVEYDIHGSPTTGYELFAINKKSSMALDLAGGSAEEGTDVIFYDPLSGQLENRQWCVKDDKGSYQIGIPEAYGNIRLVNVKTGTCMDGRRVEKSDQLSGWGVEHIPQQKWVLVPTENGYRVRHQESGQFLVEGPEKQVTLGDEYIKEFLFHGDAENGYYMLDASHDGRYVGLKDVSDKHGTKILFGNGRAQKWYLQSW